MRSVLGVLAALAGAGCTGVSLGCAWWVPELSILSAVAATFWWQAARVAYRGSEGGVEVKFSPAVAGHAPAWILDYPYGAARRSIGRQKAAVWGYWFASGSPSRAVLPT